MFEIKHKLCSLYRPESNRALERAHSTLKNDLKCYVSKDGNDWDQFLNFAKFTYNTRYYDKTHHRQYDFKDGNLILLRNMHAKNRNKQLKPEYLGPHKIIKVHDNKSASIKLTTNKIRTYNFDLLKPYVSVPYQEIEEKEIQEDE